MASNRSIPPRRSCLAVPAVERTLPKLGDLAADELVIDLEDSVAVDDKEAARGRATAALASPPGKAPTRAVRINPVGSPWWEADLAALAEAEAPPASVVVPKVESPQDLERVEGLLGGAPDVALQALIETAAGLARAEEIALASERLQTLIIGYADLAASLGRSAAAAADPGAWAPAQDRVLVAARAAGLQAIDGPFLGVAADAAFREAAQHARGLGFDGKWAIHPRQAPELDTIFTPSDEETERARRIIDSLRDSELGGQGAVAVDGEMVDEASRKLALGVLAKAEAGAG